MKKSIVGTTIGLVILVGWMVFSLLPKEYKWAISSIIDVPICAFRIANKIGTEPSFTSVKSYALDSLRIGMTPDEVHTALEKIAPIEVEKKLTLDKKESYEVILVRACHNPLGNIVLYVYYSNEGYMISAANPYAE